MNHNLKGEQNEPKIYFDVRRTTKDLTQSKWDQTLQFLKLANRTYFLKCLLDNFYPLPFLWLWKCSKKNLRKWTWKQLKKTKILVFQLILDYYTILESLKNFFSKNLSFHRLINFLWIFRRFSWFLLGKVVSPNLKVPWKVSAT
jgi:hypothetical protein